MNKERGVNEELPWPDEYDLDPSDNGEDEDVVGEPIVPLWTPPPLPSAPSFNHELRRHLIAAFEARARGEHLPEKLADDAPVDARLAVLVRRRREAFELHHVADAIRELQESAVDESQSVRIRLELATTLRQLGDTVAARELCSKAALSVRRIEQPQRTELRGRLWYEMGELAAANQRVDLEHVRDPLECFERSLQAWRSVSSPHRRVGEGWALYGLSKVEHRRGHLLQAANYRYQAIEAFSGARFDYGLATVLKMAAYHARLEDDLNAAVEFLESASRTSNGRFSQIEANIKLDWARIHLTLEDDERAEADLQVALARYRSTGDCYGLAHAHAARGLLYRHREEHELAAEAFKDAISLYRRLGYRERQALCTVRLAACMAELQMTAQAQKMLDEALKLSRDLHLVETEVQSLLVSARLGRCKDVPARLGTAVKLVIGLLEGGTREESLSRPSLKLAQIAWSTARKCDREDLADRIEAVVRTQAAAMCTDPAYVAEVAATLTVGSIDDMGDDYVVPRGRG